MIEKIVKNIIPYLEALNFSEVVGGIATLFRRINQQKIIRLLLRNFRLIITKIKQRVVLRIILIWYQTHQKEVLFILKIME